MDAVWRSPPKLTDHPNGPTGREDRMKDMLMTFWKDESGQDLAEYALLLGLITVAVVGVIALIGGQVLALFTATEEALGTAL